MELTTAPNNTSHAAETPETAKPRVPVGRDSSGIALFMVLAAVSVLAVVVTEFTYIAQIGQMVAYGNLDQIKAHYIAKSGLKLSLLRLKAYKQVKTLTKSLTGGAGGPSVVPSSLVDKIWSFPFFYPIPTNIPGMSASDKQMIDKFQKDSGLDGKFSAVIESESSKYNLNLLLAGFGANPSPGPSSSPSPNASAGPTDPDQPTQTTASSLPNPTASYNPETARKSLYDFLNNILTQKSEADSDFATLYRDFRLDELFDNIVAWADLKYDRKTSPSSDKVQMKRAPFYSVSELHMLPTMDDDLYSLFAPTLTADSSGGININTMQDSTLRALVPEMAREEVKEFFKFRDSEEQDNHFNGAEDFYKYLQTYVGYFKGSQQAIDKLKQDLATRGITLTTEESQFKITVQAQVNSSTRTIEAWVTLGSSSSGSGTSQPNGSSNGNTTATPPGAPPPLSGPGPGGTTSPADDSGLKITFMKIL